MPLRRKPKRHSRRSTKFLKNCTRRHRQAQAQAAQQGGSAGADSAPQDNVVDADFTEADDEDKK